MDFTALFNDKTTKGKVKSEVISNWLLTHPASANDLILFAKISKDPIKASCIEAMEFASKIKPEISTKEWLLFLSETLHENAPRIKWESAKVIGNIAHLYPNDLRKTIINLLSNSEHSGTVVRWSAAFALGEIIQIKLPQQKKLLAAVESICHREEKNSIRKIYITALKKQKKTDNLRVNLVS